MAAYIILITALRPADGSWKHIAYISTGITCVTGRPDLAVNWFLIAQSEAAARLQSFVKVGRRSSNPNPTSEIYCSSNYM